MTDHEPYRRHMDMTIGDGGVVKDEFGWWLAYVVREDGTINWLGVSRSEFQSAMWAFEGIHGEHPRASDDDYAAFRHWALHKGIKFPKSEKADLLKWN